jgi:hypothetical protein
MLIKQPHGFTTSRQGCRLAPWRRGCLIVTAARLETTGKWLQRAEPWSLKKTNSDQLKLEIH